MKDKIERILVTTDGSPESEDAFAAMMPIVRADNPEVALLYVFEEPTASFAAPERVAQACGALRANGVSAHLEIRAGKPVDVIVEQARKSDLIVIATHGRGGLKRLVLGSVTEGVLRQAKTPVLVTRPGVVVRQWTRLVVALDGSPRGEEILGDVIPLARRLHAEVDLVRAAMPPITGAGLGDVPGVHIYDDPRPYLEGIRSWLATQGIDATSTPLEGRAGAQILRHAEDHGTSLLCMSTHGRSGVLHALMGSIAEEVIRGAPCPVLLRRSVAGSPVEKV
jgi:nucleotide-binding universal stress UspA family protein